MVNDNMLSRDNTFVTCISTSPLDFVFLINVNVHVQLLRTQYYQFLGGLVGEESACVFRQIHQLGNILKKTGWWSFDLESKQNRS